MKPNDEARKMQKVINLSEWPFVSIISEVIYKHK